MARKIWRYTMTTKEMRLWQTENMQGWRESLIGCVEDEARENGCKKYVLYDRGENIVAKDTVRTMPRPEPVEF